MSRDLSFERAIAFAGDLIRIPSPSGEEGEIAERVLRELEALGFDDAWIDDVGNVIGRVAGSGGGGGTRSDGGGGTRSGGGGESDSGHGTVMLSCHLDVVGVGDPDGWEHPPFGGDIADGSLHGRGAMDIKGPLALQTYAAARFLEDRAEGDVYVAHTVFEERGGWGMSHLLEAGEVEADAVIIGESTHGDVCIGHRGRAELIVEIMGEAGHASAPDRARNALDALPHVLNAIHAFSRTLGSDPVLGASTLAPTGIEALPESRNVIPDRVRVVLDWRVLPEVTADGAVDSVAGYLREHADLPDGYELDVRFSTERQRSFTGREAERRMFSPGFLLDGGHAVARSAAEAVADATGRAPAVRPWTFATDGGHTCGEHGIPTIGYAPGEERYAHTARERLALDAAREAYEAYPAVVRAVQRVACPI